MQQKKIKATEFVLFIALQPQRLFRWFKLNILTSATVKSVNRPQIIDLNDILLDL